MLSSRRALAANGSAKPTTTAPIISPAVVRSLYRRLFREVSKLEANPMSKTLFPLTAELQTTIGVSRPLYVPGSKNYTSVLRGVFRDGGRAPNIKLAFDTLNRLRAHDENVRSRLPLIVKEREAVAQALAAQAPRHAELYRATPMPLATHSGPQYVPATASVPSKVVLRDRRSVELEAGTVLLAHPLSSTHVDRRVMIITERTPVMTSGLVLDLQYIFPVSRGNPMFPEVFWGHEVYDGGFNQINLTMPPTAQVVVLHTLEVPTAEEEAEMQLGSATPPTTAQEYVSSWLKWGGATSGAAATAASSAALPDRPAGRARGGMTRSRQHELLCQPLIRGGTLSNGETEPTLYVSKVEALPYLAKLAAGQPRSSLRLYWGSMRWMTSQIETEVGHGHWFPAKISPSFFRSYDLAPEDSLKLSLRRRSGKASGGSAASAEPRFPTTDDIAAARRQRERRFGADVPLPQVFPAEGAIRRRDCLWDEIMYAMGGEYASLVGGFNPFMLSSAQRNAPQILAPLLPGLAAEAGLSEAADAGPASPTPAASGDAAVAAEGLQAGRAVDADADMEADADAESRAPQDAARHGSDAPHTARPLSEDGEGKDV